MQYALHKVVALPGTLDPNSVYFVLGNASDANAEVYITDTAGVAKGFGNSAMINNLISTAMASQATLFQVVADIGARDALFTGSTHLLALVSDASADSTVDSGAAFYAWDGTAASKVAEFEGLDVVQQWANITGGPASAPAAIDAAVGNAHTHANTTSLDKLGENAAGGATYDGTSLTSWGALNW